MKEPELEIRTSSGATYTSLFRGCDAYVLGPGLPGFDAEPMNIDEALDLVSMRDTRRKGKDIMFPLPGDGTVEVK